MDSETSINQTRQPAYPSSARRKTNWEQLASSAAKEEEEAVKNFKSVQPHPSHHLMPNY
jgi:hypothetical protein